MTVTDKYLCVLKNTSTSFHYSAAVLTETFTLALPVAHTHSVDSHRHCEADLHSAAVTPACSSAGGGFLERRLSGKRDGKKRITFFSPRPHTTELKLCGVLSSGLFSPSSEHFFLSPPVIRTNQSGAAVCKLPSL